MPFNRVHLYYTIFLRTFKKFFCLQNNDGFVNNFQAGSKSSDITYQYLHEMRQEQGERIYPRVLFEKILDFNKLQFYDDLFKYFVEILKGNNPNQNNS